MSAASDALAEGFSALLAANGEPLTFRGSSVTAIVRRDAEEPDPGPGKIDLNARDTSSIELRWDDLPARTSGTGSALPSPGESFTDEFGYTHRVQKARRLGFRLRCECQVFTAQ
jgi:hypothetical protein